MNRLPFVLLGLGGSAAIAAGVAVLVLALDAGPREVRRPSAPEAAPVGAPVSRAPPEARAAARKSIETRIAPVPEYQRFFDRLRLALPSQYEATFDGFADRLVATGKEQSVDTYLSEAVRELRQSRGALAARADGPLLARIFDVQLAMLDALSKTDQRLCVDFLYGSASEAFYQFSATNRQLASDMAIAGLEAIVDGQAKKNTRQTPTDADFALLEKAMAAKGLSQTEIEALLDGKTPDPPLEDARLCRAGRVYLEMLKTLPEPVRLRIYALAVELMARS
ncbi:MAG: hypothetical protein QOH65_2940 [Methylobacteriaceae bacterium]|jgi:hypothetical protein|nr:hypothetical protein [Methylobacteriaceae bacterium]